MSEGDIDREKITLAGTQETMLATLYGTAMESRWPNSILRDQEADKAIQHKTTRAMLAAYRHAPAEVRDRASIRKIVTELTREHPRVAGVRQLATAVAQRDDHRRR